MVKKIILPIILLLFWAFGVSCKNTLEDTLYNKKIERLDEITEEVPQEVPGDEIVDDDARWNRVYFGSARWTR